MVGVKTNRHDTVTEFWCHQGSLKLVCLWHTGHDICVEDKGGTLLKDSVSIQALGGDRIPAEIVNMEEKNSLATFIISFYSFGREKK